MLITLNAANRIWAVPAVLGQAEALRALHGRLRERLESGDGLVYLGNYMGYGAAVADTMDELLRFRADLAGIQVAHLRGAQEEMWVKLLEIQWAMRPIETFKWMMAHGVEATLRAYGGDPDEAPAKFRSGVVVTTRWTTELREAFQDHAGHYEFLHGLASAAPTSDGRLLFVNAGINPEQPLEKQNDAFWWNAAGFEGMAEPFENFTYVIRGFDADHNGVRSGANNITVDAGKDFAGPLRATAFGPDGAILETLSA
jgi:serine/threonine protein phosphatase 1